MTLSEAAAHVGDEVIYDPGCGCPAEEGVITAANKHFVLVRYGLDFGSRATPANLLRLVSPRGAS